MPVWIHVATDQPALPGPVTMTRARNQVALRMQSAATCSAGSIRFAGHPAACAILRLMRTAPMTIRSLRPLRLVTASLGSASTRSLGRAVHSDATRQPERAQPAPIVAQQKVRLGAQTRSFKVVNEVRMDVLRGHRRPLARKDFAAIRRLVALAFMHAPLSVTRATPTVQHSKAALRTPTAAVYSRLKSAIVVAARELALNP